MDYEIDAIGEFCPIPIIRAELKLKQVQNRDRVIIKTDHSCSSSSVANHFTSKFNYPCNVRQLEYGIWEIIIEKVC
ncbi:sulfurtransferase TusA family protein [Dethiobacter alkaliphilus]|uniref:SirA-like protein n=1 Tax=Dethiobacter alkaliphilus AHT 1 TaxID=555088 RepID=C0GFW0_DETAL|nr:sulfurtransferase TusA family protein [Dethiobacter alkaliphilus]EEG77649.1 SirA-like protein [Dethiobacter alkaliphilus AHT 1]